MAMRLQLVAGVEVLEEWADSATQAERNVLYEALFAIGDGSVFLIYDVFGDPGDISNFIILVKADLMVKINVQRAESAFEILYVGSLDDEASTAMPEIAAEVEVDIDDS